MTTCPKCRSPLYRVPETTTPREVIRAPGSQPEPLGGRMSGSPIEITQDDEIVPPAVPVAASRRGWVIAGGAIIEGSIFGRDRVASSRCDRQEHEPSRSCPNRCQPAKSTLWMVVPSHHLH